MTPRNRALLEWYQVNRRTLPWRGMTDPWAILVSEVMAQQTQVARVADRFGAFLGRFPTPESLAAASAGEVLEAWSGLGYNRRGMRLRDAARQIVEHGWPESAEGLAALPGVGAYTAAAVACFALGEQIPAVDTNLRRVLTRWHGSPMSDAELGRYATGQLASGHAAEWNQALMDLGASHCRPRNPDCSPCPVAAWCTDPDAYLPPPRQGVFEGSQRQARGAVLKALLHGPATTSALADATRLDEGRLAVAARSLEAEGMVTHSGASGWALAE